MVKNLPAMQETPVRSLGREDPLETEMINIKYYLLDSIEDNTYTGGNAILIK